jgi:hypothetical protein
MHLNVQDSFEVLDQSVLFLKTYYTYSRVKKFLLPAHLLFLKVLHIKEMKNDF